MKKINYLKWDVLMWYTHKVLFLMRLTTVMILASGFQLSAAEGSFVKPPMGDNIGRYEDRIDKNIIIKEGNLTLSKDIIEFFSTIDVHGRVLGEDNQPLQGATVKIKGGTNSTSTNANGEFSLQNVDANATLVISFIGYDTKEIKASENLGNIQLVLGTDKLEEVEINAGYYKVTDRERTGSISKITSKDIEKQPVLSVLQSLQNRVPGIQITQTTGLSGGGFNVQIRGRSSINPQVGNKPLYIIDGIIYPSTGIGSNSQALLFGLERIDPLGNINPNDIESVEILKDADATAIYGSRGANGVILIKTKRGMAGVMKINAGLTQGFSQVSRKVNLLNTQQYIEMRTEAINNDGLKPLVTDYDINGTWDRDKYTNWQKELIGGTANNTNASLNVSGGTDNLNYLLGSSYYSQGTVFPGDFGFSRFGLRSSLNLGSKNKLSLTFTANYNHTQNNIVTTDPTANILLAPNAPDAYDEYGQLNWANNTVFTNPMASLLFTNNIESDNMVVNATVSYRIIEDLVFKVSGGYNLLKSEDFIKTPLEGQSPARNPTSANRTSSFSNSSINSWTAEPQISFAKKIGRGKLSTLLGLSLQESINKLNGLNASNFSSDEFMDNILAAGTVTPTASIYTKYRYTAIFGRLNYSFENKLFINLTARRDGSTRFGKDKQFANFGALGVAYVFSDEEYFKKMVPFVSLGKIRTSYGITGNDQIGDYQYLSLWYAFGNYQNSSTLYPNLGNAEYAWETNRKGEIALQLGFLKDRITLEMSYYNNRSSNQLIGDPLPPSTGNGSIIANRPAVVQNTGWEFSAGFKVLNNTKLSWSTTINLTIPRNKLISYPGIENTFDNINYVVGQPLSIRRVYNVRGVNGQTGLYDIEDKDGNGVINDGDRFLNKFTGQYLYGGWQNSISFKGLTLDFLISGVKQNGSNYFANAILPGRWSSNVFPGSNQLPFVLERWRQINDNENIQKFSTATGSQTTYNNARLNGGLSISDASYVRLKNISLSYNLPNKLLSKMRLSNVVISFSGQNIFTITNYQGLDPETQSLRVLPPLRTLAFGISLTL